MKGSPPPANLKKSMRAAGVGAMMMDQMLTKPLTGKELHTVRQNTPREKKRHRFRADKAQHADNEQAKRAKARKHQRKARKRNRTK